MKIQLLFFNKVILLQYSYMKNIVEHDQKNDIGDRYIKKTLADTLLPKIQELRNKILCVMGGCGQIGSHIITKLYEFDFHIDNIFINDNLSLGKRENLPEPLRDRVNILSHPEFIKNPNCTPDIVIFVGGRSSAPHFSNLDDVMQEITAFKSILEWCVKHDIRLIFASTSSLCKERPSVETKKVWPGSLYELTKLVMEEMAIQQALCEDLSVQICRFFSVYGVTEQHKGNFGNLYTQLLWHAREEVPFELWGEEGVFKHGEQTRDTIFADEVARAVLFLLTLPVPKPRLDDISTITYNVGQGKPVSVLEMIQQVSALGKVPQIIKKSVPQDVKNYVVHTWGNPEKLYQAGFVPLYDSHEENLRFINQALDNIEWYWEMVEQIRSIVHDPDCFKFKKKLHEQI